MLREVSHHTFAHHGWKRCSFLVPLLLSKRPRFSYALWDTEVIGDRIFCEDDFKYPLQPKKGGKDWASVLGRQQVPEACF